MAKDRLLQSPAGLIVPHVLARMTGLSTSYLDKMVGTGEKSVVEQHVFTGPLNAAMRRKQEDQQRDQGLAAIGRAVAGLLEVPEVVEGIQTCNWKILETLLQWVPRVMRVVRLNSHDRGNLVTLALYLQRLCTKCDTNGAYGPVFWGSLDETLPQVLSLVNAERPFGIGKREVNTTYWVASLLLQHLISPLLKTEKRIPRCHPMLQIQDGSAWCVEMLTRTPHTFGPMALDVSTEQILHLCLGEASVADIAKYTGIAIDSVCETLNRLEKEGWITWGPEIPIGLAQPLSWVKEWVKANLDEATAAYSLDIIENMQEYASAYADARGQERRTIVAEASAFISRVTGEAGTRGSGQFYADRYAFSEDAARNWEDLRLGEPVTRILQNDLLELLRAFMCVPIARWNARHAKISEWFTHRFGDGPVPLSEFCRVAGQEAELCSLFADAERVAQKVATDLLEILLASDTQQNGEVAVDRKKLAEFVYSHPLVPCAVQPDIMILMTQAGPKILLGDLHATHDLLTHGTYTRMHPCPDQLVEDVWHGYKRVFQAHPCVPIMEHTDQTITSLSLPTYDIEISGKSRKQGPMRMKAGDLTVVRLGQRLQLLAPGIGPVCFTRVPVWYPASRTSVLALFAPPTIDRLEDDVLPQHFGVPNSPRIVFGDMVVVRKTWIVDATTFTPEQGATVFGQQLEGWCSRVGVPLRFFVRLPFEQKPVFIDTANPFLMEWLRKRLVNREVRVQLTEVYPDLPDLWLKDEKGSYCIEFRLSTFLFGDSNSEEER